MQCQIDVLESCLDLRSIEAALDSLPDTLDETYNRILHAIPLRHFKDTIRVLQLLVYSKRPITIAEAVDAIAVDTKSAPYFESKYRMPNPHDVLHCCSSLVIIRSRGSLDRSELRLAHASVKEFLISDRADKLIAQDLQEDIARRSLADMCLSYLLHFKHQLQPITVTEEFPLAEYASSYWMVHAKAATDPNAELLSKIEHFFCGHPVAYSICYSLHRPDERYFDPSCDNAEPATALYYASLGNLIMAIPLLLSNGVSVNAQGGRYGSPIQAASQAGHVEIVQLLLKAGADPNLSDGSYRRPLNAAAYHSHADVVEMLLTCGAKLDEESGRYGTAIYAAASSGKTGVMEALLEKGADPNLTGSNTETPLFVASSRRYSKAVNLLLQHSANPNIQCTLHGHRGSKYINAPLYAVSTFGDVELLELLLQNGADPNARGGYYSSALIVASVHGFATAALVLLKHGADPNSRCDKYDNGPLYAASCRGHAAVVKVLLDNGADPSAIGGKYGNALFAASVLGDVEVVDLLLKAGADPRIHGTKYDNPPLYAASLRGKDEVVKLLLEHGADANAVGGDYRNALSVASVKGHVEVVKLLLTAGADVHGGQSLRKDTPLHLALSEDKTAVVDLLLDSGASPSILDEEGIGKRRKSVSR